MIFFLKKDNGFDANNMSVVANRQCCINEFWLVKRIFKAKAHIQTACEFHDFSMGFAGFEKKALDSYTHSCLCKNNVLGKIS